MSRDRLHQLETLFHAALNCPQQQREGFVSEKCAGDEEMRRQLEVLLAQHESPFLGGAAVDVCIGQSVNHYRIDGLIGAGGMSEVYRARDTKLGRDVAFKVLLPFTATNPELRARLRREAQLLAALNHPNIASIYGFEETDKISGLVLEMVNGETLAERIKRGPIAINDSLQIAVQIAEALEAAHEKGIVHRDLKPSNVKITSAGTVKVLDFGIAKMLDRDVPEDDQTARQDATASGMILGTASYMSPEQARGKPADRRTDVWAFGCILYEMLTGYRVFEGETVAEILAAVFKGEPDWNRLPPETPMSVRRLLRRCLQKDRNLRLRDVFDARLELMDTEHETGVRKAASTSAYRIARAVAAIVVLVTMALAVPGVRHLRETKLAPVSEMQLQVVTPSTRFPLQFALSPDGQYIVFVGSDDGAERLWLRPLDKPEAQPLTGTAGAQFPFWSGDSRSIGFFAASKLYRIDVGGGAPQALASAPTPRGGAWNADGTILFAPNAEGPLMRIPAKGGQAVVFTRIDTPTQSSGHRFPRFLSDGRHFLFFSVNQPPQAPGLYLGSLDGTQQKRVTTAADTAGDYLAPDQIAFIRQGALIAQRLNVSTGDLAGDPVTIAEPVGFDTLYLGGFSISKTGLVAYRTGGAGQRQLVWLDRTGKPAGPASEPDSSNLTAPELSPDGRRVAVSRTVQNKTDAWIMDLGKQGLTRFTFDSATNDKEIRPDSSPIAYRYPIWSPDGGRIVFTSKHQDTLDLYVKPSSGAGTEHLLLETPNAKIAQDWSRDARYLLYAENDPQTAHDLWALDMTAERPKPRVVVKTRFDERMGQFSPDGHWVAYQSNKSSRFEIWVQAFPEPNGEWQVSTNGGIEPRWRADGKELYFIAPDGKLMAIPVTTTGATFETETPVALLPTRIVGGGATGWPKPQYAVARDGRFLINVTVEELTTAPITIILNWASRKN